MNDNDVMIRMTVQLQRNGEICTQVENPNGSVHCNVALILGMLDVARQHVVSATTAKDAK